jgi:NAD(P)-dependent dehydrogenase (short-subunit alcohol dehydrogenase family)
LKTSAPGVIVTFIECDLASLASIRAAVAKFTSDRLDLFIGNAGIVAVPPSLTKDGYEIQFGTNHVGHAALLKLLLPTILRTAETEPAGSVRVVLLTSAGYALHPSGGIQFDRLTTTCDDIGGPMGAKFTLYGQSKLANLLYASELSRRYPSITSVSVHPGAVQTDGFNNIDFWSRMLLKVVQLWQFSTPVQGALTTLWAATVDKDKMQSGAYYEPVGVLGKLDKEAESKELAAELWEWTEKELQGHQV